MIIDLRDYTTTLTGRDLLIERCESLLFPEQERLGATILGVFRDADQPTRYVWLRGMPDMPTRKKVLGAFYTTGAMWQAHKKEVNAWIVDSDDVLLVRADSEWGHAAEGPSCVGMFTQVSRVPLVDAPSREEIEQAIHVCGGRLLVRLATDPVANNYPRHPIRTGETGFVWLATFPLDVVPSLGLPTVTERRLLPSATSRLR